MSQKHTVRRTPSRRKIGRYVVLVWAIAIGFTFVPGDQGLYHLWQQRRKIERLKSDIEALERERTELEEKIERLKNDMSYIEKIAREEYGMVRPGERVYRISFSKKGSR